METIEKIKLIFNVQKTAIIPKNFRTSLDEYLSDKMEELKSGQVKIIDEFGNVQIYNNIPSREGLETLNIYRVVANSILKD